MMMVEALLVAWAAVDALAVAALGGFYVVARACDRRYAQRA